MAGIRVWTVKVLGSGQQPDFFAGGGKGIFWWIGWGREHEKKEWSRVTPRRLARTAASLSGH